jgi:L-alanine-DL-glutamate epimerase-like enolase superfamily enzyme
MTRMKIQSADVRHVRLPLEEPIVNAPPFPGQMRDYITLRLRTADGIEGIGVTAFGGQLTAALKAAVVAFADMIIGDDALRTEAIAAKLRAASAQCLPGGIAALALSAIDIALWDIRGKAFNTPLYKLLGGLRAQVPAYASGALMRTTPIDGITPAAEGLVKKGYRQIKTQMAVAGLSDAQEIERIRLIREVVGPDIALMVDINQRWKAHEAISIGRRIEDIGLAWLEDPLAPTDYQGLATVADALATPVCAGEYLYGIEPFQQLMRHGSVDIVMIDLLRVGGITPWMKVAGMAEAFNLPVVSHLLPEIHAHLVAAAPNGLVVEYMPWTSRLFDNPPVPENGMLSVPEGPGLGLRFAPGLFESWAVSS